MFQEQIGQEQIGLRENTLREHFGVAVDKYGKAIPGLRLVNIDYFNPQGVTVDLGVHEVPATAPAETGGMLSRYILGSTEAII